MSRKRRPGATPPAEKCNARKKSGGGLCSFKSGYRTDHVGRGRCYLHGGRTKGAKVGPENANWKHGARAGATGRAIVPLTDAERELVAQFESMSGGKTAAEARAKQALLHDRAFRYALRTGDQAAAQRAAQALVALLDVEERIQKGGVVQLVIDEQVIGAVVDRLIEVLIARITDKSVLALVIQDFAGIDWQAAILPTVIDTTAAVGELG